MNAMKLKAIDSFDEINLDYITRVEVERPAILGSKTLTLWGDDAREFIERTGLDTPEETPQALAMESGILKVFYSDSNANVLTAIFDIRADNFLVDRNNPNICYFTKDSFHESLPSY